jgi:histidyl-tRNA synthetase
MAFKKIKGATDYYPDDKYAQEKVFSVFSETAEGYGFSKVEAPAIETIELLTAKSGEEIKKQIFTIEKKGSEDLGLRFEFTASVARMFIEKQKAIQKPVKWFSIDRVWRYERPQAGRDREFYQYNAEIYGSANPEADAEVINLAIDSLLTLGLSKDDFYVKINNRKLLFGLLSDVVPEEKITNVIRVIDKRSKISEKDFETELDFLGKAAIEKIKKILTISWDKLKDLKMNDNAEEGYKELSEVIKYLDSDIIRFDITVARGLDYYTGTVFEIFDKSGKYRALAGGGRYDTMIELFGGQKTPATGFAMGYSTLSMLLSEKKLLANKVPGPDYYIATITEGTDEKVIENAVKIAGKLRKKASVVTDLMRRQLGKQLSYADSINAKNVIFVGPEEIKKKKVKIKNMESGKETEIEISKI